MTVSHAHVLTIDLVLVMQGGVGHRHPAHEYRRKAGHWRQRTRSANLDVDAEHGGELLLGRVFVRHRPARLARDETECALQIEAVDLVDHAVDIERQLIAACRDVVVKGDQCRRPSSGDTFGADWNPHIQQGIESRAVGGR